METANAAMSDQQGEGPTAAVAADVTDAIRLKVSLTKHASCMLHPLQGLLGHMSRLDMDE